MKILKVVLFVILGIVVVLGIAGAVMPKTCSIQESLTVNAGLDETFDYLKIMKNQEEYSVWINRDPNVKMEYQGTDGTIGAMVERESNKKEVGEGEQEIISVIENQRIDTEIRFEEPMEGVASTSVILSTDSNDMTKITNTFVTKTPFPSNIMTPFYKNMLRKDMQANLQNIKKLLESGDHNVAAESSTGENVIVENE